MFTMQFNPANQKTEIIAHVNNFLLTNEKLTKKNYKKALERALSIGASYECQDGFLFKNIYIGDLKKLILKNIKS